MLISVIGLIEGKYHSCDKGDFTYAGHTKVLLLIFLKILIDQHFRARHVLLTHRFVDMRTLLPHDCMSQSIIHSDGIFAMLRAPLGQCK